MSKYIVEMYDECEKYSSEYGCKPTNTHGFPLREEIVRCHKCKHYEPPQPKNGWNGYCMTNEHDTVPDGFCKWGEKRDK